MLMEGEGEVILMEGGGGGGGVDQMEREGEG